MATLCHHQHIRQFTAWLDLTARDMFCNYITLGVVADVCCVTNVICLRHQPCCKAHDKFCCTDAEKGWEFVTYNFLFSVLILLFLPGTVLLLAQYHTTEYIMPKMWSYTVSPTVTVILDWARKLCNWFLQNFNCAEKSVFLGCDTTPPSISFPTFRDGKVVPRDARTLKQTAEWIQETIWQCPFLSTISNGWF